MAENNQLASFYDPVLFRKNSAESLERFHELYVGKHVAWSMDGKQILASGGDMAEVSRELKRLGIATDRVVFDYFDDPNVSNL
jgi:hypothetical protein